MRILHTNFLHGWGGQSNRIFTLCEGLAQKGCEIHISAPDDSVLVKKASQIGLNILEGISYKGGARLHKIIPDILKLRKFIKRGNFDIVHVHGSQDSWAAGIASIGLENVTVVRTKHNVFRIRNNFMNRLLYGRLTDAYIGISEAIIKQLHEKPCDPAKPMALIHSAVDVERFANIDAVQAHAFREEFGVCDQDILIGAIGRLRPEKGFTYLIKAIPKIVRKFPNAKIAIIGGGSMREELAKCVKNTGVSEYVILTGFRTDIPVVLDALDLFVMPSISEGLGTAVLEAMAARKTIIATNVGGIPDSIKNKKTGLLVPPSDSDSLARAIITLLNNKALAKEISENAADYVKQHFTPEALIDKTLTFYQQLRRHQ